jgi:hypothetical protein
VFVLVLVSACVAQVPPTGFAAPEYDLDIDAPYETKYHALYPKMCPAVQQAIPKLIDRLTQAVKLKIISNSIYFLLTHVFGAIWPYMVSADTKHFIQNVADTCKVKPGDMTILNYIYDFASRISKNKSDPTSEDSIVRRFFRMCTSVIFQEEDSQTFVLGSNLDYPFKDAMKDMLYQGNHYKGTKLVAQTLEVFGIKGCLRIVSHKGKFAASLNQRYYDSESSGLIRGLYESWPLGFDVLMDAGLNSSSYDEAKQKLAKNLVLSPVYYIIIGKSEATGKTDGCVLERNNMKKTHGEDCLSSADDKWFLAQTNYDRDHIDPPQDYRRIPMENKIKGKGKASMDSQVLDQFLQEVPNYRPGETISTTMVTFKIDGKGEMSDSTIGTTIWN